VAVSDVLVLESGRMAFVIANVLSQAGDLPVLGGDLLALAIVAATNRLHPPRLGSSITRRPGPGQTGVGLTSCDPDARSVAILF
jgi:hypothetical protein